MARRGSVPLESLNLAALAQQSPCFRRGLETILGPDAGTEQWYTTIAKLMQGRNTNSTLTSEPSLRRWNSGSSAASTRNSSYLVDPASSHMLVLKIKPCMSKYKHLYRETANGSLKQLWFI